MKSFLFQFDPVLQKSDSS